MATTTETMTSRERIRAAIDGNDVDRFPVWLKMANGTWRATQPAPFRSMDSVELLRWCGCDVMVDCGIRVKGTAPHVTVNVTEKDHIITTIWETPDGPIVGIDQRDPENGSTHPITFPGATAEGLARLRWVFRDTSYAVDMESVTRAKKRKAELAADDVFTTSGCGPTPFMHLIEHLIGPVDTYFLLQDEPALFAEVMELMHQDHMRMLEARLPHEQADTFWISENTSTTLLSPQVFKDFCAPYLKAYGDLILAQGTTIPVHHMCGTLNAILEMIDALPARVNEAFTTNPLGDVTLAEGRTRMPSKSLWGGTNATLWLKPADVIVQTVADDLARCPDRRKIFLTSAGVLPPAVSAEKAREVVGKLKEL